MKGALTAALLAAASAVAGPARPALAAPPPPADAGLERALRLMRSGDYAAAAQLLQRFVGQNPANRLAWFNLGNANYRLGKHREAIAAYERVIALKSPLALAARFYSAECRARLGGEDAALRELRALRSEKLPPRLAEAVSLEISELEGNPTPAMGSTPLERAMRSYEARDYPAALAALDEALQARPSADAHFLRGLTELRLRNPQAALVSFEKTVAIGQEAAQIADAQSFIRQIRAGRWNLDRTSAANLDLWTGFNSNVYANGVSVPSTAAATSHVGAAFRFWRQGTDLAALLEYRALWDETIALPDLRQLANILSVQLSHVRGRWYFALTPDLEHDVLGAQSYLARGGALLRAERGLGRQIVGATFDLHRSVALQPAFTQLTGYTYEGRAYWTYYPGMAEYGVFVSVGRENIGDLVSGTELLPLANSSWGAGAGTTLFWSPVWQTDFLATYFHKSYDNPSLPGPIPRVDDIWTLSATAARQLNPRLRAFGSVAYVFNGSTMDANSVVDLNYRQLLVNLGVSWNAW